MTENKTLTRFTNGMLIVDALIALWDTGLATYAFVQGRWVQGLFLVVAVAFLLWAVKGLLKSKLDFERMRMRHEHMMAFLEVMHSQPESESEEENPDER